MKQRVPPVVAAILVLLASSGASAQKMGDLKVSRLTDHIYKLSYDVGYVVNMVASVGDDGVLLVDTGETEKAESLKEAVQGLGRGMPRIIINTHAHVDHVGGNAVFGDAPIVIAHQVLRTRLRSGSYLFDEFPDATLPDITFADSLALYFNGEEIRVLAFPGAHDDNDAIVWFTRSNIVVAGDLVYANGFPSVEEVTGNVLGYREVLPRIMNALPRNVTIVCGHSGEGGFDTIGALDRAIVETTAIVERALANGSSVAQMQQDRVLRNWESFAAGYVSIDEWIADVADALEKSGSSRRTLYEPMYYSLRDGGPDAAVSKYYDLKKTHRGEYRFVERDLAFMADKLTRSGRVSEAIAFWNLWEREYPGSPLAWYCHYSRGKLHARAGDRDAALASYKRALELSPANPRVQEALKQLQLR